MPILNRRVNFTSFITKYNDTSRIESTYKVNSINYENVVFDLIRRLCFNVKSKGAGQLMDAIVYCLQNDISVITGDVYRHVADLHGSNYENVERNMRAAIEKAWYSASPKVIAEVYGEYSNSNGYKPENLFFIKVVIMGIRKNMLDKLN